MCHAACGLGTEQHTFKSSSFLCPKQVIWPRPKSRVDDLAIEDFYHGKERKEQLILGQIIQSVMITENLPTAM